MSYVYSNNGFSFRAVEDGYEAQAGEVVFVDLASAEELTEAFPQYAGQEAAVAWMAYQAEAQAALADSDRTVLRCYESGVAVTSDWIAYRKALRAIISAASGDASAALPARPAYPSGT